MDKFFFGYIRINKRNIKVVSCYTLSDDQKSIIPVNSSIIPSNLPILVDKGFKGSCFLKNKDMIVFTEKDISHYEDKTVVKGFLSDKVIYEEMSYDEAYKKGLIGYTTEEKETYKIGYSLKVDYESKKVNKVFYSIS